MNRTAAVGKQRPRTFNLGLSVKEGFLEEARSELNHSFIQQMYIDHLLCMCQALFQALEIYSEQNWGSFLPS